MNALNKCLVIGAGAMMLAGCIVREEPRPRRVYVESAPVVVEEGPPPGYVEVVPVSPGPEYVYEPSGFIIVEGHRVWRRGYWHHR